MGNSNSSESKENWKVYKIKGIEENDYWFSIKLDGNVTYSDCETDSIDLDVSRNFIGIRAEAPFYLRDVGGYIAINQNVTKEYEFGHSFREYSISRVIRYVAGKYSRNEHTLSESVRKAIEETGEFLGEIVEVRERYQAAVEYSRWVNQSNQQWTSWNMPPNWK